MRMAVMAAGAVGGYFGGRMAAAGHDVAFIARGAHRDAIRRDGLKNLASRSANPRYAELTARLVSHF
jgi:ketopantoate reductase